MEKKEKMRIPRKIFDLSKNSMHVLIDLYRAKRELSVREISKRTTLSWQTANNNLKILEKRHLVKCRRSIRRTYCTLTQEAKKSIKGFK